MYLLIKTIGTCFYGMSIKGIAKYFFCLALQRFLHDGKMPPFIATLDEDEDDDDNDDDDD